MAQMVGLAEVAKFLGIESRSPKRPGNRLWELIRAGKIDIPYVRVGRLYRFDMREVEEWWRNKTRDERIKILRRAA